MPLRGPAGTARRIARAAARGAICAALSAALCLAACSRGPATPEQLFAEAQAAMVAERYGAFWDCLTRERQNQWAQDMAGMKDVVLKNPGMRNQAQHYGYQWEEFLRATPTDIWDRYHRYIGAGRVIEGAKIIDRMTDPANGTDVHVTFETRFGQQFRWTMRQEPERGWRLHFAQIVKGE